MLINKTNKKFYSYSIIIPLLALSLQGCSYTKTDSKPSVSQDTPKMILEETSNQKPEEPLIVINDTHSDTTTSSDSLSASEIEDVNENSFHGYILSEEELSDPHTICKETASENQVTLLFAGDINFDDGYSNMNNYRSIGKGIRGVLSDNLMDELNNADIFMINNEFPYSTGGTPTPNKTFTFRANPKHVNNLIEMGVDIVSLANNHAYDHGPDALLDTFSTLSSANIPYVGAGKNLDEAVMPTYFIAGGMKIAYVSATQIERNDPPDTKEATESTPGVLRTLDPTKFIKVIEEAKSNSDFVVVYVHWGSENTYDVDASQKELASKFEAAGADLIVGDHSHCLQGFEFINDTPIIYSLGNFWFSSKNLDTGLLKVSVSDRKISKVEFLPCVQHDCRTDMYTYGSAEYSRILGVMSGLSYDVSISEHGQVSNGAGNGVVAIEPKPLIKANYQLTEEEKQALALQQMLQQQTTENIEGQ